MINNIFKAILTSFVLFATSATATSEPFIFEKETYHKGDVQNFTELAKSNMPFRINSNREISDIRYDIEAGLLEIITVIDTRNKKYGDYEEIHIPTIFEVSDETTRIDSICLHPVYNKIINSESEIRIIANDHTGKNLSNTSITKKICEKRDEISQDLRTAQTINNYPLDEINAIDKTIQITLEYDEETKQILQNIVIDLEYMIKKLEIDNLTEGTTEIREIQEQSARETAKLIKSNYKNIPDEIREDDCMSYYNLIFSKFENSTKITVLNEKGEVYESFIDSKINCIDIVENKFKQIIK